MACKFMNVWDGTVAPALTVLMREVLNIVVFIVLIIDLVDLDALVLGLEYSALCASRVGVLQLLEDASCS